MARAQRIEYEGAVYHVTVRGNERRAIFHDDIDRERLLVILAGSVACFEVRLYLYCLMTNHVHLVVETPRANLGRFMHQVQTAYTVYFNRRHRRHGHLMQGRYGARLVGEDAYILKLSRYVHLNPVFIASVRRRPVPERLVILRQYPWSSYRGYIAKSRRLAFVDYAPILAMISPNESRHAGTYRRFVEAGIADVDAAFIDEQKASRLCIGSEGFRDRVATWYDDLIAGKPRPEDIAFRRTGRRLSAERILAVVCERLAVDRTSLQRRRPGTFDRAVAARMLCDHAGLTQRQVADLLRLRSGAAVSLKTTRHDRKGVAQIAPGADPSMLSLITNC